MPVPAVKTSGGDPALRNAWIASGSRDSAGVRSRGKPVTAADAGQSGCGIANQSGNAPRVKSGECSQRRITERTGGRPSVARSAFSGGAQVASNIPRSMAANSARRAHSGIQLGKGRAEVTGNS